MSIVLASRFKSRRKELKLSQKELAKGICEQSQISRIEQGNYTPGAELLYLLSKRMSVPMEYFFDNSMNISHNDFSQFKRIVESFLEKRDYNSIHYLYNLEKSKPNNLTLEDKIYMDWVRAMVKFYCLDEKKEAITLLKDMMIILTNSDINFIRIINTLSNFYHEIGDNRFFEDIYKVIQQQIQSFTFRTLEELKQFVKVKYNISRYLWLEGNIKQAESEVKSAIKICQDNSIFFHLGHLYCLLGNVTEDLAGGSSAVPYYKNSYFFYRFEENINMADKLNEYIQKLLCEAPDSKLERSE